MISRAVAKVYLWRKGTRKIIKLLPDQLIIMDSRSKATKLASTGDYPVRDFIELFYKIDSQPLILKVGEIIRETNTFFIKILWWWWYSISTLLTLFLCAEYCIHYIVTCSIYISQNPKSICLALSFYNSFAFFFF